MKNFRANYIDFLPFHSSRRANSEHLPQRHIPTRRDGYYHMSMTCLRGSLYIFGGIDRTRVPKQGFVKYDTETMKSTVIKQRSRNRFYNVRSASCSRYGDDAYFFGGLSSNDSKLNRKRVFQVVRYNFRKNKSDAQILKNFGLRYGHTTVIFEGRAFLYGGDFDVKDSDAYEIDCRKFPKACFKKVEVVPNNENFKPQPAFGLGSAVIDHYMYIFFGAIDNFGNSTNQVARLDLKKMMWEEVDVIQKPNPRFGIGCVKSNRNNMVYIFGGSEGSSKLTNELLEFDYRLRLFRSIEIQHQVPEPRFGHSIALSDDDEKMWIFGGVTGRLRCDYDTSMCCVTSFADGYKEPMERLRNKHQYFDCVILTQ